MTSDSGGDIPALPSRPVLRWHGAKWRLAPWVLSHFPPHRIYVEPFGGAASVLLRKPRCYAEIYNDLDDEIVTLFRVLRDPAAAARLEHNLRLTPFARTEFEACGAGHPDPVERARRLIVRASMGFASNAHSRSDTSNGFKTHIRLNSGSTGFRSNSTRSGSTPAMDFARYPDSLVAIIERMRGVIIENRDAIEIMRQHDGPGTLHYADPPYLPETRSNASPYCLKHKYRHELSADDHAALLAALRTLEGMVILSGYPSTLYDAALPDWRRAKCAAYADGARERIEVLWINPAACAALDAQAMPLFQEATE